jgi:hypothetical protein
VLAPDEKKASFDTEATDSEPTVRLRDEPSPIMVPASPRPKLNPGRTSLPRRRISEVPWFVALVLVIIYEAYVNVFE